MERDQVEGESLFFQDLFAAFNPSNYYPANDDPWVPEPIRVSPERHHDNQSFGAAGSSRPAGLSLPGWWSTGPSESGTLPQLAVPSDSGYETRENASILDGMDWSQDIQSIAGRMGDLNPFAGLSLDSCSLDSNAYGESGPGPTGPAILDSHNFAPPDELKCNMCEKPVRTKSELMYGLSHSVLDVKCPVTLLTHLLPPGNTTNDTSNRTSAMPRIVVARKVSALEMTWIATSEACIPTWPPLAHGIAATLVSAKRKSNSGREPIIFAPILNVCTTWS